MGGSKRKQPARARTAREPSSAAVARGVVRTVMSVRLLHTVRGRNETRWGRGEKAGFAADRARKIAMRGGSGAGTRLADTRPRASHFAVRRIALGHFGLFRRPR